jgi:FixJ family two-component response regulator
MARKKITNAPERHSQRWTNREDQLLVSSVKAGLSSKQIARKLDRTVASIWSRKVILGVDTRINGGIRTQSKKIEALVDTTPVQAAPSAMFSEITEVISKMTKQYGVKATVIVFEG